jgi:hypothetical protein
LNHILDKRVELAETVRDAGPEFDIRTPAGVRVKEVQHLTPDALELPQRHGANNLMTARTSSRQAGAFRMSAGRKPSYRWRAAPMRRMTVACLSVFWRRTVAVELVAYGTA